MVWDIPARYICSLPSASHKKFPTDLFQVFSKNEIHMIARTTKRLSTSILQWQYMRQFWLSKFRYLPTLFETEESLNKCSYAPYIHFNIHIVTANTTELSPFVFRIFHLLIHSLSSSFFQSTIPSPLFSHVFILHETNGIRYDYGCILK